MVIDRRIACVSSNNIQDRVNLEMNLHLEGPIVDAFYDMALLSWAEPMDPPLPLLVNPSLRAGLNEGKDCLEEAKARKGESPITFNSRRLGFNGWDSRHGQHVCECYTRTSRPRLARVQETHDGLHTYQRRRVRAVCAS